MRSQTKNSIVIIVCILFVAWILWYGTLNQKTIVDKLNLSSATQEQTISGTLGIVVSDDCLEISGSQPQCNDHRTFYSLIEPDGTIYQLNDSTQFSNVAPRSQIQIKTLKNNIQTQTQGTSNLNIISGDVSIQTVSKPTASPDTIGDQKTAIILAYFKNQLPVPFGDINIRNVSSKLKNWFAEVSGGKVNFTNDIYGWYQVPTNIVCLNGSADFYQNTRAIINASDPHINFSSYQRILIFYPADIPGLGNCSFGGISSIDKQLIQTQDGLVKSSLSAMNAISLLLPDVASLGSAHELGHGLGVMHANAWDCGSNSIPDSNDENGGISCKHIEYGNLFDTMGRSNSYPFGGSFHYNAYFKEMFGWLANSEIITPSSGENTYSLTPLEASGLTYLSTNTRFKPKVLKIPQHLGPDGQPTTWYYVEYRAPLGADRAILTGSTERVYGKLFISRINKGYIDEHLLDATPQTKTFIDADVPIGSEFIDSVAGIKIKPLNFVYSTTDRIWTLNVKVSVSPIQIPPPPPPSTSTPPIVEPPIIH
jgi:hypothetical protein